MLNWIKLLSSILGFVREVDKRIIKLNFYGIIKFMDKKSFKIDSIKKSDDYSYWKGKTYLERIEALEKLREIVFGYDASAERLQRVFKVTNLKKNKKASGRHRDLDDVQHLGK
ncbi:MAG: hypothetical protein ABH836_00640 [Candidatus Omnitrophota bacterium]